jgi:uncharacterized protein (TIGR02594 family)
MFDRRKILIAGGGLLTASSFAATPTLGQGKKQLSKNTCAKVMDWGFREPVQAPAAAGAGDPRSEEVPKAFRLLFGSVGRTNPIEVADYFSKLNDKNKEGRLYREEWPEKRANPMIVGFFSMTQTLPSGDQTPWCAAFVNFCLFAAGYVGTNNALSGSFRSYGKPRDEPREKPQRGDIVVFRSPGSAGDEGHGHVGFFAGEENGRLMVLGGNQTGGEAGSTGGVKVATFARSSGSLEVHSIRSLESFRKPETT